MLLVAVPSLIFYGLLLPSAAFVYLHKRVDRQSNKTLIFRFGLLFSGYTDRYWWYELILYLRKVSVILLVTFASENSQQLHVVLGILVVLLYLQEHIRPFEGANDRYTNQTELNKNKLKSPAGIALVVNPINPINSHSHSSVDTKNPGSPERPAKSPGNDKRTANIVNKRLHQMEVVSLLILLLMVWCAVFFVNAPCQQNDVSCTVLIFLIIGSNVLFAVYISWSVAKAWTDRARISQKFSKISKALSQLTNKSSQQKMSGGGGGGNGTVFRGSIELSGLNSFNVVENPLAKRGGRSSRSSRSSKGNKHGRTPSQQKKNKKSFGQTRTSVVSLSWNKNELHDVTDVTATTAVLITNQKC